MVRTGICLVKGDVEVGLRFEQSVQLEIVVCFWNLWDWVTRFYVLVTVQDFRGGI